MSDPAPPSKRALILAIECSNPSVAPTEHGRPASVSLGFRTVEPYHMALIAGEDIASTADPSGWTQRPQNLSDLGSPSFFPQRVDGWERGGEHRRTGRGARPRNFLGKYLFPRWVRRAVYRRDASRSTMPGAETRP